MIQMQAQQNVGGIAGLAVLTPTVHGDDRGYFMETYNQRDMESLERRYCLSLIICNLQDMMHLQ